MPLDRGRPFTRAEALTDGITAGVLRGPRFRRLFTGVYVAADAVVDARVLALAALRLAPERTLAARHTAAVLMGGVVPHSAEVHLLLRQGRMRVPGVRARRGVVQRWARLRGVPMTTAEDTFVQLARDLDLVDLVVLGDSLVKADRTSPSALVEAAGLVRGKYAAKAQRAAGLVRAGVDSPMESRLRMLLVLAGLPEPVVNHVEYDDTGQWLRRFDLSYPEYRLAIEYDGRQHAENQRQWEHDVDRRDGLDHDDWRLVVVLARGIYREPAATLSRVTGAMQARGMRAAVSSDEWERHFPGHR